MKKKTSYITFCAVISALSVALMLASYFPYLTYAIPALSGALIIMPLVEADKKYAFLTYLVSAVLVFIFAEAEAKLMYITFFGYYPILKAVLEKIKSRFIEYTLKFICFNGAITVVYFGLASLFGIEADSFGEFGKWSVAVLYVLGNIAFILYDMCLTKLCGYYMYRLHEKIKKIMRF